MTNNRVRYTVENILNSRFYQMPKFLFEGEFKALNNDARVMYSLLKDRHELSLANGWVNEKGEVYLIYTREEMADMLGCSQPTLRKAIASLKKFNLMEEERQGLNRPNLIYLTAVSIEITGVKNSFSPECKILSVQNENNLQSGMKDNYSQECKILSSNDTDINDTDNKVSLSIDRNGNSKKDGPTDNTKLTILINSIINNLQLDDLKIAHPSDKGLIDEIELNIREMLKVDYITVSKGDERLKIYHDELVYILGKLTYWHIDGLISKYKDVTKRISISNHKAYLQTMIYNMPFEFHTEIQGAVAYDTKY